ncbi:phytase [Polluticaenibacter yanchengensis]|uniref:Phytase n=1 Tax=Polluticaenibacter yanchengensis TaxID=3014562 RepID=A0ABT4UGL6_9BACT|nr:phytase [Chitinophagaceae bacterium LY-5]
MKKVKLILPVLVATCLLQSCGNNQPKEDIAAKPEVTTGNLADAITPLKPVIITDTVEFDTDDPAIWLHPTDKAQSLIIGTDKETGGGIYAFDLNGKIVKKLTGLQRPNNIDIAYGLSLNSKPTDIAVFTERKANKIRIVSLPDLAFIDNGGIEIFKGEKGEGFNEGMGIALYTSPDKKIYAIVGRKNGPADGYLWQYELDGKAGTVTANVVRKFGKYSAKKEIEAIAVDNENGFVYYSDEQSGIRKYYADPAKGNEELAFFGTTGFTDDHEGISIYKTGDSTGYILVSNQQDNSFMVYPREGSGNIHQHNLITKIQMSTIESDGSDVTNISLNNQFPNGLFVAMSNGKVFHYYDWRDLEKRILKK